MPDDIYQADLRAVREILYSWIVRSAPTKGAEWINQKLSQIWGENPERSFYLAFGQAPRFVGKEKLQLIADDISQADNLRKGWRPFEWTADQATRILFLLSLPHNNEQKFIQTLEQLFNTGDVGEQTALYLSLPLLPYPKKFRHRTTEGIRTNMTVVFNAISLDNPYPAEYLEEAAWNQLVLKTIFVGSPLSRIQGIEKHANAALASTLSDFAHERWAAKRPVPVELWRPVGPFINEKILPDMEKLFASGDPALKNAAALACYHSNFPQAKALLDRYPELKNKIDTKALTWENIND